MVERKQGTLETKRRMDVREQPKLGRGRGRTIRAETRAQTDELKRTCVRYKLPGILRRRHGQCVASRIELALPTPTCGSDLAASTFLAFFDRYLSVSYRSSLIDVFFPFVDLTSEISSHPFRLEPHPGSTNQRPPTTPPSAMDQWKCPNDLLSFLRTNGKPRLAFVLSHSKVRFPCKSTSAERRGRRHGHRPGTATLQAHRRRHEERTTKEEKHEDAK